MTQRIGRAIAKAKGVIPDVQSSQNSNSNDTNIFLQAIFPRTSAEVSESGEVAPALPVIAHVVAPPVIPEEIAQGISEPKAVEVPAAELELHDLETESYDQNPKLKRFRAKTVREAQFDVDVEFLRHVIHVLFEFITAHGLSLSSQEIRACMSFFGEVEVRTSKRKIIERGTEDVGCCSPKQQERIIEVVKKVLVLGVNVAKYCPELVAFLADLGIAL
jgi:hypothetical protein